MATDQEGTTVTGIGVVLAVDPTQDELHCIVVHTVSAGGPADAAGIVEGDTIVSFDGEEVTSLQHAASLCRGLPASEVVVGVKNRATEEVIHVPVRRCAVGSRGEVVGSGLHIIELANGNKVVESVVRDGAAYDAGFRVGDRIISVDGSSVQTDTVPWVCKKLRQVNHTLSPLQVIVVKSHDPGNTETELWLHRRSTSPTVIPPSPVSGIVTRTRKREIFDGIPTDSPLAMSQSPALLSAAKTSGGPDTSPVAPMTLSLPASKTGLGTPETGMGISPTTDSEEQHSDIDDVDSLAGETTANNDHKMDNVGTATSTGQHGVSEMHSNVVGRPSPDSWPVQRMKSPMAAMASMDEKRYMTPHELVSHTVAQTFPSHGATAKSTNSTDPSDATVTATQFPPKQQSQSGSSRTEHVNLNDYQLQSELSRMEKRYDEMVSKLGAARNEINQLQRTNALTTRSRDEELSRAEASIDRLRDALQKAIASDRQASGDREAAEASLNSMLTELREQKSRLEQALSGVNIELKERDEKLRQMDMDCRLDKARADRLDDELVAITKERDRLGKRLEQSEAAHVEHVTSLEQELQQERLQRLQAEQQLIRSSKELELLRSELSASHQLSSRHERDLLQERLEARSISTKRDDMAKQLAESERLRERAESSLSVLQSAHDLLQDRCTKAELGGARARQERLEMEQEVSILRQQLKDVHSARNQLETALRDATANFESVVGQRDSELRKVASNNVLLQAEHASLQQRLDMIEAVEAEANRRLQDKEKARVALSQDMAELSGRYRALETSSMAQHDSDSKLLDSAMQTIDTLQNKLEETEERHSAEMATVLEQSGLTANIEIENLQKRIEQQKGDLQALRQALKTAKADTIVAVAKKTEAENAARAYEQTAANELSALNRHSGEMQAKIKAIAAAIVAPHPETNSPSNASTMALSACMESPMCKHVLDDDEVTKVMMSAVESEESSVDALVSWIRRMRHENGELYAYANHLENALRQQQKVKHDADMHTTTSLNYNQDDGIVHVVEDAGHVHHHNNGVHDSEVTDSPSRKRDGDNDDHDDNDDDDDDDSNEDDDGDDGDHEERDSDDQWSREDRVSYVDHETGDILVASLVGDGQASKTLLGSMKSTHGTPPLSRQSENRDMDSDSHSAAMPAFRGHMVRPSVSSYVHRGSGSARTEHAERLLTQSTSDLDRTSIELTTVQEAIAAYRRSLEHHVSNSPVLGPLSSQSPMSASPSVSQPQFPSHGHAPGSHGYSHGARELDGLREQQQRLLEDNATLSARVDRLNRDMSRVSTLSSLESTPIPQLVLPKNTKAATVTVIDNLNVRLSHDDDGHPVSSARALTNSLRSVFATNQGDEVGRRITLGNTIIHTNDTDNSSTCSAGNVNVGPTGSRIAATQSTLQSRIPLIPQSSPQLALYQIDRAKLVRQDDHEDPEFLKFVEERQRQEKEQKYVSPRSVDLSVHVNGDDKNLEDEEEAGLLSARVVRTRPAESTPGPNSMFRAPSDLFNTLMCATPGSTRVGASTQTEDEENDSNEKEIRHQADIVSSKRQADDIVSGDVAGSVQAVPREALVRALKNDPIFSKLGPVELDEIQSKFVEVPMQNGEAVVKQGDPSDAFFMLVMGQIEIWSTKQDNQTKEASQTLDFVADAPFGLGAQGILYSKPRGATAITKGDCLLYKLDKIAFLTVAKPTGPQSRESGSKIRDRWAVQQLRSFLKNDPLFGKLEENVLEASLQFFTKEIYAPGDVVMSQGDVSEDFFLLSNGNCEVWVSKQGRPATKEFVAEPGTAFGAQGLTSGKPRSATVVAQGPCTLWKLPKHAFISISSKGEIPGAADGGTVKGDHESKQAQIMSIEGHTGIKDSSEKEVDGILSPREGSGGLPVAVSDDVLGSNVGSVTLVEEEGFSEASPQAS